MPRVPTLKMSKIRYTRELLEDMNRPKIQATAKAWGVKANMKTKDIIEELLRQMEGAEGPVVEEAPQEIPVLLPVLSGASPSAAESDEPEEPIKEEPVSPQMPPPVAHPVVRADGHDATRNWQRQLQEWNPPQRNDNVPPSTPPQPASRIQARDGHIVSPHPYHHNLRRQPRQDPPPRRASPMRQSMAGPSTINPSISRPNGRPIPMPKAKTARALSTRELRRTLRCLTVLVNQQITEKAEAVSIKKFQRFLHDEKEEAMDQVNELAWGYAAIQKGVVDVMQSDPTLVDGSGLMERDAKKAWQKYVDENYLFIGQRVEKRHAMIDEEWEGDQEDEEEDEQKPAMSSDSAFSCEPQAFGTASRSPPQAASTSYRSKPQGFVYDEDDDMSD